MSLSSKFAVRAASSLSRPAPAAAAARTLAQPARAARIPHPARTARRHASSSPSVSDPKITAKLPQGNDTIWAISSVVVFGSLFFYLTSPGSKSSGGHGAHGSHGDHKHSSSPEPAAASQEDAEQDKPEIDFVVVEEPKLDVKTPGGEILKERLIDDHTKQVPANNKSAPLPNNGETFKHGVAAAKDGDHISNPKAVVEAAHQEKAAKYADKRD